MIQIKNLSFAYDEKLILKDIHLEARKGEILCLLGPNGAGKSTLLDCLLGINHQYKGSVTIDGLDIKTLDARQRASNLSYVAQKQSTSFPYKVLDMVTMGRACHIKPFSKPTQEDIKIAKEALDFVGMKEFEDRKYTELSGGEGQLVMIARALTQKSDYILMDEPTAHLDYRNELLILEMMKALVEKEGRTIIMATHFPNHAFYFHNQGIKTQVAFIQEGDITISGAPDEVLTEETLNEIYQIESKVIEYQNSKDVFRHVLPLYTKEVE